MNEVYPGLPFPSYAMYIIMLWSILWKGIALWRASKNDQRNWFLIMLIINTVGLLEIVYLFWFAKKKLTLKELAFWKTKQK